MPDLYGYLKAKFHYAIQVAHLGADLVRVVCVSQTARKLVESQLQTGLRPGSSYLDISIARTCLRPALGKIPLRYPGRRLGLRLVRAGLRPARDFFGVEKRSQTGSSYLDMWFLATGS